MPETVGELKKFAKDKWTKSWSYVKGNKIKHSFKNYICFLVFSLLLYHFVQKMQKKVLHTGSLHHQTHHICSSTNLKNKIKHQKCVGRSTPPTLGSNARNVREKCENKIFQWTISSKKKMWLNRCQNIWACDILQFKKCLEATAHPREVRLLCQALGEQSWLVSLLSIYSPARRSDPETVNQTTYTTTS